MRLHDSTPISLIFCSARNGEQFLAKSQNSQRSSFSSKLELIVHRNYVKSAERKHEVFEKFSRLV